MFVLSFDIRVMLALWNSPRNALRLGTVSLESSQGLTPHLNSLVSWRCPWYQQGPLARQAPHDPDSPSDPQHSRAPLHFLPFPAPAAEPLAARPALVPATCPATECAGTHAWRHCRREGAAADTCQSRRPQRPGVSAGSRLCARARGAAT